MAHGSVRRTLGVIVVVAGLLLPPSAASALSCAAYSARDLVRVYDVIYVGVVVEEVSRTDDEIRYRMDVRRTVKGAKREERTLRSYGIDQYSVPREFVKGTRILVVGNSIGICSSSGTRSIGDRADRLRRLVLEMSGRVAAPHVVERREWLWSIARDRLTFDRGEATARQIRIAADKIYDRNAERIGADRDHIEPGTRLMIPRLR